MNRRLLTLPIVALLTVWLIFGSRPRTVSACTTAVISGQATVDGRPLLWKNRDTSFGKHNEVTLIKGGQFLAIGVVNAGDRKRVWMGVNSAGFCIENSLSTDLADPALALNGDDIAVSQGGASPAETSKGTSHSKPKAPKSGNGSLMRQALQRCATVDDFRKLLEETNPTGRGTVANFGVIDAQGGAAMFETGPSDFTMFDANDPADAPHGYIVRTNFATTARDLPTHPAADQLTEIYSGKRYLRACSLIDRAGDTIAPNKVSLEYVLRNMTRDLADESGNAFAGTVNAATSVLPASIETQSTISRTTTVSAAVFHGVRPGEDPTLTTMWTILGDPKFSIAVPCWVGVDAVADDLTDERGAEIGEIAITLRDWYRTATGVRTDGLTGIWTDLWPIEDEIVQETQHARESWLRDGCSSAELTSFHNRVTDRALVAMQRELLEAKQNALTPPKKTRVAIYDHSPESKPARGCRNLLSVLTPEHGFECQRLRPEEIRDGRLASFEVLVRPGGSGSKQAEMLQETGRHAVREFVKQGGGYVGICAGAYLASAQYDWSLNIINARVWDRAHWARGTGTVNVGLTPAGSDFFDDSEESVPIYYGQGPLLVPGDYPELASYEVLATYETEIAAKGAPVGAMLGTHAIIRGPFGSGRVICFSPHAEVSAGPHELVVSGVNWAASRGGSSKVMLLCRPEWRNRATHPNETNSDPYTIDGGT